jgi:cyclase
MRRAVILAMLMAAGGMSIAVRAYQAPAAQPKVVEVEKVRDNLFMLKGGGGNTAVYITDAGVVVVDTKNEGWGPAILEKIKTLTSKPVTTIINTHTHGDHTGSNSFFGATVDIVAQENTKANMERMDAFKSDGAAFLPKRTFKDRMSVKSGADTIELYYFGPGHTNGDAWVVFPTLRVVHAGDMFAAKGPPLLDAANGGSGTSYPVTLTNAWDGLKDIDTIITGHSTTFPFADLKEYAAFNADFLAWAQAEMKAGKSVDEAAAEYELPEKYAGYTAAPARVKANVQVIYNESKK